MGKAWDLARLTTKIFQCRDERWRAGLHHDLSAVLRRSRRRLWWIQGERRYVTKMLNDMRNERKSLPYDRTSIRNAIELIVYEKEVALYGQYGICLKGRSLVSCSGHCGQSVIDSCHPDNRNNALIAVLLEGHNSYGYNDTDLCRCWDDRCVNDLSGMSYDMKDVVEVCNEILGVYHKGPF